MNIINKILNEEINKFLINEYLDKKYSIPLYKYFNMSDSEKEYDLMSHYIYMINDFIDEYYNKFEDEIDNWETISKDIKEMSLESDFSLIDEISNGKYEFLKKDLLNYIDRKTYDDIYAPAWRCLDYDGIVKNEWLIHFSDNAYNISKDGFKYGTSEVDNIAYSGAGDIKNKFGEGYDFAYLANDFNRFYRNYSNRPKYGNEAVIFRASGVKLWHYGDEEYQVVFYGPSAKNFIYIQNSDEYGWCVESYINGNILYYNDNIENVVIWAINNYDQYRKHLIDKKGNLRNKNFENNYDKY